jgi:hypothetical protein
MNEGITYPGYGEAEGDCKELEQLVGLQKENVG